MAQNIEKLRDKDPAAAVAANPNVVKAYTAAQATPDDPNLAQAALQATLDEQTRLGIPDESQHVLTNTGAASIFRNIKTAAQGNQDAGAALDGMAQKYGPLWPKVFGDLVQQKLPGYFQVLANLDTPAQASARMDLQHAFAIAEQKGGLGKLGEMVSPTDRKYVDDNIDSQLQQFRNTFMPTAQAGVAFDQMKEAARSLAYYRTGLGGQNSSSALTGAIADIAGRYDFDGTIRAPKGTIGDVRQAADAMTNGLKPDDLAPIPIPGMPTPQTPDFDTKNAPGMLKPGNLEPWFRSVLKNPGGGYSTTSSISIGTDNGEGFDPDRDRWQALEQ